MHFLKTLDKHQGPRIKPLDISGSCATIVLIVNSECYVAQLGESPAVLSVDGGKYSADITPNNISKTEQPETELSKYDVQDTPQKSSLSENTNEETAQEEKSSARKTLGAFFTKKKIYKKTKKVVKGRPKIMKFQIQPN